MTQWTPADRPRVLATAEDFERADALVGSDERATAWFENARQRADALLDAPPVEYEFRDGVRLLFVSRDVKERALTLAGVYRLTGDERYADRLFDELAAAADFPDWNPDHFLDVAELTLAFAVGYDWCHGHWSPSQRATLRDAMVDHGLSEALPGYRADDGPTDSRLAWMEADHNWNAVCNGGLAVGAFALHGDARPDRVEDVITGARDSIERPIAELAPNGGWPESVEYFRYNAEYLAYFLTSALGALDTDFGYLDYPGVDRLGDFPLAVTAPNGTPFRFGDATTDSPVDSPALFWFARRFDRPAWGGYQRRSVGDDGGLLDLLWYDPEFAAASEAVDRPLDAYFPGAEEIVTMRARWGDPDAPFVAVKGGDNQVSHGDLDLGTVVFDAAGVRWAVDLGPNDYNVPGYWESGVDAERWRYYRKRAEGHNVPVVDPGPGPDQHPFARASVERFERGPDCALAVLDLSATTDAADLRRGVALADGRERLVVRDEVAAASDPVDLWWFLHAASDVDADGRRATLTRDGESVTAHLAAPADAAFEVREAAPLPDSPHPEAEAPVEGVRKLAVHLPDADATTVSVHVGEGIDPPAGDPTPLDDWSRAALASLDE